MALTDDFDSDGNENPLNRKDEGVEAVIPNSEELRRKREDVSILYVDPNKPNYAN